MERISTKRTTAKEIPLLWQLTERQLRTASLKYKCRKCWRHNWTIEAYFWILLNYWIKTSRSVYDKTKCKCRGQWENKQILLTAKIKFISVKFTKYPKQRFERRNIFRTCNYNKMQTYLAPFLLKSFYSISAQNL